MNFIEERKGAKRQKEKDKETGTWLFCTLLRALFAEQQAWQLCSVQQLPPLPHAPPQLGDDCFRSPPSLSLSLRSSSMGWRRGRKEKGDEPGWPVLAAAPGSRLLVTCYSDNLCINHAMHICLSFSFCMGLAWKTWHITMLSLSEKKKTV